MTNEERQRLLDLAYEIEHSIVSIQGEDSGYHLSEEAKAEASRCLRIIAGAKVEEGHATRMGANNSFYLDEGINYEDHPGWMMPAGLGQSDDLNDAAILSHEWPGRDGIFESVPVRRYTFTEQLTTEQP